MRFIELITIFGKSCRAQCAGVLFLAICVLPIEVFSEIIEVNYEFEHPRVEKVKIDNMLFDRITLPGAPNSGKIGHPALPCHGAHILLPYDSEMTNIEINTGEKILIGERFEIEPMDRPFILSSSDNLPPIYKDPAVYSLKTAFPETRVDKVDIQYLHGYRILILKINPLEYIPATGILSYYPNIAIRITTIESEKNPSVLRNMVSDEEEVTARIDNPGEITSYQAATRIGGRSYDMLIITPAEFVDAFMPLKDYHDSTGVLTEIHTLAQIGAISAHTIRDYIRQEYLDNGIQYVLLGGDDDLIPSLKLYVVSWLSSGAVTEYNMPGDFYFSCLDGTFNYDNDDRWGEPTDGEDGGDVDLFAELGVGRVSAGSVQEVTNLVNKELSYLASSGQYLDKVLLAGEQLRFGGWGEYGGYAMDEMVGYSDAHGFLTYAFSPDVYNIEKLYDYLIQPSNYWPASEMIAHINAGYHIIDHLGHSGPGYAMRTDTFMLRTQLMNTEYCFVYAEGCSAGQFDLTDCWAEHMTVTLANGAFGCVANSRLGLGSRTTRHPVHVFNREFWDAIYSSEENKPQIGRAISDAKADHAYHIDDPGIRWTFYELTLFGDPALAIKPVRALALGFPDGIPEQIIPDSAVSFTVQVAGIGEGSPVSESGLLHYTVSGREAAEVAMVEISPSLYEATLPPLTCDESIEFYVSVEETSGARFYLPDSISPMELRPISDSMVLFEDDFETDKGWSISGGLWERGIPTGQGGTDLQYPVPDPTEGCNGPNVFGYNLNGDYENYLSAMYLTSPVIDCSGRDNVYLKFCRWLGVEQPIYDEASIQVSNDGTTWYQVWINYATIGDLEWEQMAYDISDVAANQETVYLRWVMGPTDGGLRFNGWNIDDVRVLSYKCEKAYICGDTNSDQVVNVSDAVRIINYIFAGGDPPDIPGSGDVNCDDVCNVSDAVWIINYVFVGGNQPCDTDGDQIPDC